VGSSGDGDDGGDGGDGGSGGSSITTTTSTSATSRGRLAEQTQDIRRKLLALAAPGSEAGAMLGIMAHVQQRQVDTNLDSAMAILSGDVFKPAEKDVEDGEAGGGKSKKPPRSKGRAHPYSRPPT
jgi:hypothetical protein